MNKENIKKENIKNGIRTVKISEVQVSLECKCKICEKPFPIYSTKNIFPICQNCLHELNVIIQNNKSKS